MIKLIWAQTPSGTIGNNGQLPWKIPEEMKHFRNITLNHDILMGRKTFESLNFRPLPHRFNYILTNQNHDKKGLNYQYINDFRPLLAKYQQSRQKDLYVIGGKEVIELFFAHADEIIVSIIKNEYPGAIKLKDLDWAHYQLTQTKNHSEFIVQYWQKK